MNVRKAIRLFVIVGMIALSTLVLPAPAARACMCASTPGEGPEPPLAFEGTAVEALPTFHATPVWRFRVLRADRGAEPGTDVDVAVSVPRETPEGTASSSCDISPSPLAVGARYRITASAGDVNGERHFFASQCSGSLELVRIAHARALTETDDTSGRDDALLAFGAALFAAAAVTTVLVKRRTART